MTFFAWSDDLSVGNEFIDADHKKLVAMIDKFHEAMAMGKGGAVVGIVLDNLIVYTREHFHREEVEMQKIGYPLFAEHKREHDLLIQQVQELHQSLASGKTLLTLKVASFLKDWLANHIKETDQLLASALR
ncbi:MAG: hemerythrin family protein [Xanthomonadaceae bacterium]|nr:hemerythrin family protein [Xanthomonadaceae bacterium]MDE2308243.1 hemerythrin family protein [Xanthomonadaceae bacterium]